MEQILEKVRSGQELTAEERRQFFDHYREVSGTNTRYNGCAAQIVNLVKELDASKAIAAIEPVTPKALAEQKGKQSV